jgi:catechol-2,3-dioxygenase
MARHLKETGVEMPWARENTYAVEISFNDPDGNRLEVYNEEPGGSRWAWEGQYASKILVEDGGPLRAA